MRKEKGIFSLLDIIKDKNDIQFNDCWRRREYINFNSYENIEDLKIINDQRKLINII